MGKIRFPSTGLIIMRQPNKRPIGITILAIWFIFNAITGLASTLYSIFSGDILALEEALLLPKFSLVALHLLPILFGIWTMVLGIGLWQMRYWSWLGTIITSILWIAIAVVAGALIIQKLRIQKKLWKQIAIAVVAGALIIPKENLSWTDIFGLIFPIVIAIVTIYYCFRPVVKETFDAKRHSS